MYKQYYDTDTNILNTEVTNTYFNLKMVQTDFIMIKENISFSDKKGSTFGGHLCYNTLVNTTCELAIVSIDNYSFIREYDEKTGYDELVIYKKEDF